MQTVLLVVQLLIAVALIGVILIQRTAQDGGGLMGGGSTMGGLFTARGSANAITRVTAVLATLFIVNSLALGVIASRAHREKAFSDMPISGESTVPAENKAPEVPSAVPAAVPGAVPNSVPAPASTSESPMTPVPPTTESVPAVPQVPTAK